MMMEMTGMYLLCCFLLGDGGCAHVKHEVRRCAAQMLCFRCCFLVLRSLQGRVDCDIVHWRSLCLQAMPTCKFA